MAGRKFTNLDIARNGRERSGKGKCLLAGEMEHLCVPNLLTFPRGWC
jgi:hypothetical protein